VAYPKDRDAPRVDASDYRFEGGFRSGAITNVREEMIIYADEEISQCTLGAIFFSLS
jgi:hypothetical protein